MTTTADLISETRQHFLGGIKEQKNKLGSAIDADDTTVAVDYDLGSIGPGAVLSIGLERMYVWAAASMANIVVERGWDGTAATTHADGAIISVNARCDDFSILRAINNDLASLSSPNKGLYRLRSVDLTYNPSSYGYDLTSAGTVIGPPLEVWAEGTGTGEWVRVPPGAYVYNPSADTSDFASGRSLDLIGYGTPGQSVRVVYRAPFVPLTTLAQDVQAVSFLPATANDIPPMGAALQLATGRPFARSDAQAQGSTRRAEEVSTQDTLIATSGLRARHEDRIRDEALRLVAEHGQAI